jgi:hypothetical protein
MKFLLPRVALISLAFGVCSAGYAQEPVPIEFYRPLKNSVSVGVRMIGGNAKVGFSNIGYIPPSTLGSIDSAGNKYYHNGVVGGDSLGRFDTGGSETYPGEAGTTPETSGTITMKTWYTRAPVPGSQDRYIITKFVDYVNSADTSQNYRSTETAGEFVDARAGYTRDFRYGSPSQVRNSGGTAVLDMNAYSVSPTGATAQAESEKNTGVELQFGRIVKRYKGFEWGLNFAVGASTINAKTRNVVRANLHTATDTYAFAATDSYGQPINASDFTLSWYESSWADETINSVIDVTPDPAGGDPASSYVKEGSRHLSYNPIGSSQSDTPADVFGYWQIKGAYYMLKLGPIVRFSISKKWTITAGGGFAGAYLSTKFIADEYILLSDVMGPIRSIAYSSQESTEKRFIPGYYADVNIERWLTVRTGFYIGYGYEKLGDYKQMLDGRRADIDLGSSGGFRFGIITRF